VLIGLCPDRDVNDCPRPFGTLLISLWSLPQAGGLGKHGQHGMRFLAAKFELVTKSFLVDIDI